MQFKLKQFRNARSKSYDTVYTIDQLSSILKGNDAESIDFSSQYSKSLYVFAAINKIASKTADIDFKLARILNNNGETDEVLLHPILDLLAKFNPFQTKSEFLKTTLINKKLTGEAFWLKVRNGKGEVAELWNLRPDLMGVVSDPEKYIKHYEFWTAKGKKEIFQPEDIIHFKEPDPLNPLRGMSPLKPASTRIETEKAAAAYQANFFKNNARPDALLLTEESLDTEQRDQMMTSWEERHEGSSSGGKLGFLEGGMKYQQVSISQREMDYIESMKFTRDDILVAFGVPKGVITLDDVNYANAEASMRMFMSEVVAPEMDQLEETINEFMVIPDFGEEFYIYHTDPVPPNPTKTREDNTAGYGKWLTVNEIRATLGLEPIEGGDVIADGQGEVVTLNLQRRSLKRLHGKRVLQTKFALKEVFKETLTQELKKKTKANSTRKSSSSLFPDTPSRVAYFKLVNKRIDKRSKSFKDALIVEAEKQQQRVVEKLKSEVSTKNKAADLNLVFDAAAESNIFATFALPFMVDYATQAGQDSAELLGEDFTFTDRLRRALVNRVNFFADSVTNTTFERLTNEIVTGLDRGEGIGDLTERVQSVYSQYPEWRANLIARTEATAANNEGLLEQYRASSVVKGKEWVATIDDRTRDEHFDMDEETVPLDSPFSNGLDYPQEPNCRCVIAPALFEKSAPKKVTKRVADYSKSCDCATCKGGPGSGNHGHSGRPGRRGGSTGRGDSGAWAPVMSKEDAEKYVEGSEYTATLYHGTLVKHKDSIEESGLVPGEMGFYGNGVYFSNSNTISNEYGKLQVEAKVMLENPAVFNSVVEFNNVFDDFAEKNKIGDMDVDAMSKFSNYLSSNHDGVIITNNSFGADIVTVFDPKNIAVYNITNNEN